MITTVTKIDADKTDSVRRGIGVCESCAHDVAWHLRVPAYNSASFNSRVLYCYEWGCRCNLVITS